MSGVDQPRPVRSGEELDLDKLSSYLAEHGLTGELSQEQFPGGYSNLTYLLRVGDTPYVLRRPPRGANIRSAHDMGREYRLLSGLYPVYPKVPRPVLLCNDDSVLGSPFYLMERVEGLILRGKGNDRCRPELMGELSSTLLDLLVDLHTLDYQAAGLGDLGKPDGYVARQVSGWSERWGKSETEPVDEAHQVIAWLAEHQPPAASQATLIHNDFKYDNLVLDPNRPQNVLAVLDWEMATIGDPLMDLGTTLGYWIDPSDPPELKALGFGPTFLPGSLTRQQLAERYANRSGAGLEHIAFYYAFGLFKIAVIAQQIYARYRKGLTTDPRFQHLNVAVLLLLRRALSAQSTGQL
jgi:aminoglycoside phosphotransferase (APT) family kinase protein